MASIPGRGAQVRLDGDAQKLARGAGATRLVDSLEQKAALERAGISADGYTPDGSTVTGQAAEDEALTPGGVVPDIGTVSDIATTAANTTATAKVVEIAVPKAGGAMTGALTLATVAADDATKKAAPMDAVQGAIGRQLPRVATIAALRAIPVTAAALATTSVAQVKQYNTNANEDFTVRYNATSTAADNNITVFKPDSIAVGDPGRWERIIPNNNLKPIDAGARGNGVGGQQTAVQAAWDFMVSKGVAYNSGWTFGGNQPAYYLPPGLISASGTMLTTVSTGTTVYGEGRISQLDGWGFFPQGLHTTLRDFYMVDSRGITAGTIGLRYELAYNSEFRNVAMRDKDIGMVFANATRNLTGTATNITRGRRGIDILAGGDSQFSQIEINNMTAEGVRLQNAGEYKFDQLAVRGTKTAMLIRGYQASIAAECYFDQSTLTLSTNIATPIIATENAGGKVRFRTGNTVNVTSIAEAGKIFAFGDAEDKAQVLLQINGTGTGASSITAGGTELLSAPVTGANASALVDAIVANINAGSTGYTAAKMDTQRLRIYAPLGTSYNGIAVTVTLTGGYTLTSPNTGAVLITTDAPHGYVLGQDVRVNAGPIQGICEVQAVPSTTSFIVQFFYTATATGTTNPINRFSNDVQITITAARTEYNGARNPIACTDITVDFDVAYTSAAAGGATLVTPGYDLVVDARDLAAAATQHRFNGGNINRTLIKSGRAIRFHDTRLKSSVWIDDRAYPPLKVRDLEFSISDNFSVTLQTDVTPSGCNYGWVATGMMIGGGATTSDANNLAVTTRYVVMAPDPNGGMLNGKAARINTMSVSGTGIEIGSGTAKTTFNSTGIIPPRVAFADLANLTPAEGTQVQVSDRNNRIATRTGTAWTDQTGATFA